MWHPRATQRVLELQKPRPSVLVAFGIHILTASGAFFAFLALVAAAENNFTLMFLWLGVALFIDGIDGPLARKINVKALLPNWSGDMIDSIVDYATFCLIPAFALYQSGFLQEVTSFLAAALIVITSAIYYADTRMKTRDNCFKGFPVCWNMLVFTLFVIEPGWWLALGLVVASAVLTFFPIMFVHPVRVRRWRATTLAMFALWTVCGLVAIYYDLHAPTWAVAGIAISAAYLYCVGAVMQMTGKVA